MGLDMYLTRRSKATGNEEDVAYWRKANQIHNWFVNNIQNGEDNCAVYQVLHNDLMMLLGICEKILATVEEEADFIQVEGNPKPKNRTVNKELALKLMPPRTGFFFGSGAVDNWYIEDLEYTKQRILEITTDPDFHLFEYFYTSSW